MVVKQINLVANQITTENWSDHPLVINIKPYDTTIKIKEMIDKCRSSLEFTRFKPLATVNQLNSYKKKIVEGALNILGLYIQ